MSIFDNSKGKFAIVSKKLLKFDRIFCEKLGKNKEICICKAFGGEPPARS